MSDIDELIQDVVEKAFLQARPMSIQERQRTEAALDAARAALRDYCRKLEEGQRWIPCDERLPERGIRVLARGKNGEVTIASRVQYGESQEYWSTEGRFVEYITKWMPLP